MLDYEQKRKDYEQEEHERTIILYDALTRLLHSQFNELLFRCESQIRNHKIDIHLNSVVPSGYASLAERAIVLVRLCKQNKLLYNIVCKIMQEYYMKGWGYKLIIDIIEENETQKETQSKDGKDSKDSDNGVDNFTSKAFLSNFCSHCGGNSPIFNTEQQLYQCSYCLSYYIKHK